MDKRVVNCKQRYAYHPRDRLQLTCIIYVPGHYSDKCKVLNGFGNKYSKDMTFKYQRQEPAKTEKVWK